MDEIRELDFWSNFDGGQSPGVLRWYVADMGDGIRDGSYPESPEGTTKYNNRERVDIVNSKVEY